MLTNSKDSFICKGLGAIEMRALWTLTCHAGQNRECFVSLRRMSKITGVAIQNLSPALRKLEERGIIQTIGKRRKTNIRLINLMSNKFNE